MTIYGIKPQITKNNYFPPLLDWSQSQVGTYFLGRTLISYTYIFFIIYIYFCYPASDIFELQKVAIQGFELGPCHMIQIFPTRSTAEPTSSVTTWKVHLIGSASPTRASKTQSTVMGHDDNRHGGGDDTTMAATTR